MHQALKNINQVISNYQLHNTPLPSLDVLSNIITELLDELLTTFSLSHDNKIHVHLYQRTLQRLAVLNIADTQMRTAIINLVATALANLQDQFPAHFNYDEQAVNATAQKKNLVKKFSAMANTSDQLLLHTLTVCKQLLQSSSVSWRTLYLLQQFETEFDIKQVGNADPLHRLVQYNLNHPGITQYIIDQFRERITEAVHPTQEIQTILRQLGGTASFANCYLQTNLPSLKDQLESWLHNELSFFSTSVTNATNAQPSISISTPLSVSQLAAFVRLLVDAHIIQCTNQRQLLSLLASNIKTSNAANISSQSLRNKYYGLELNALTSLKDICINLLNHARKMANNISA